MTKGTGKYNFINIEKIKINNFSLYSKDNSVVSVKEEINNGVYCLAGANGLGKTTFLNIINYGLTGLVLKPDNDVYSPDGIIKFNKDYTERYFEGRIKAKDKEKAEIEILFSINNIYFRIIRGFNNREELKLLEIFTTKNNKKISALNTNTISPIELNVEYEKCLTHEMGIGKFEYFIFFQLYVLTFDENRRMLFWDDRASTNTLSLAFNYDISDTDKILELKSELEALESHGRNARWQATQIKNKKESLLASKKEEKLLNWDKLKQKYKELVFIVEENENNFHNVKIEYDTLLKRQNIVNSEILQLKIEYKKLFSRYSEPRSKLLNNQYIKYSIKENECFLCGSTGHYVVDKINKNLHKENCPVCSTAINEGRDKEQKDLLNKLKDSDIKLESKNSFLDNIIFETEAKKVELEKTEFEYYSVKEKLNDFEKENSNIKFDKTGNMPIDDLIEEYQKQFDIFDLESKTFYEKRDNIKPEYENLLSKVNSAYKNAEKYFVPLFKKLAKSFIGLDLNIYFKRKGKDIILNFELLGTSRTESFQLSESQRFFLDIALRMTLAVYLSKQDNNATLLIDTPEGSLDIAYESRVGKMFADFVIEYNQNIIMTANINASQLLISLAEKCGEKNMQFRRMLEWTDLTEIQKEGEHLFEKVYNNIELVLKQ